MIDTSDLIKSIFGLGVLGLAWSGLKSIFKKNEEKETIESLNKIIKHNSIEVKDAKVFGEKEVKLKESKTIEEKKKAFDELP